MKTLIYVLFAAILLAGCQPAAAPHPTAVLPTATPVPTPVPPTATPEPTAIPPTPTPSPQDVANSWVDALNKGDIDATLSYLAEDAVVTISPFDPNGDAVFTGHDQIRTWYESQVAGNGSTTLSNCQINGETITCLDTFADDYFRNMGVEFIEGDWIAVVRDGKIQSYIFKMTPETLAKLAPPPEPTATPALSPEAPVSSAEDVLAVWSIYYDGEYYLMEFMADGFYRVGWKGNLTGVAQKRYTVENNLINFLSRDGKTLEAVYEAYVTKQDGRPVALRFVLVGEDTDVPRKTSLAGQTVRLAAP